MQAGRQVGRGPYTLNPSIVVDRPGNARLLLVSQGGMDYGLWGMRQGVGVDRPCITRSRVIEKKKKKKLRVEV